MCFIITYFDSWDDLKHKIESADFDVLRKKIKNYAKQHRHNILEKWNKVFNTLSQTSNEL